MYRNRLCVFVFVCACVCASLALPYGPPPPVYAPAPAPYAAPYAAPSVSSVSLPETAEAAAAALTNAAGAKASAAKINVANWKALQKYGVEIGVPLLVKPYGPLTPLYAASLPPRSFVGKIDPTFVKDSYGKVQFIGESAIGVLAV